jgi:Transposase DDE domain
MSHRDGDSRNSSCGSAQELAKALAWLLSGIRWKDVELRADCGWTVRALVTAALLWAWSGETTLKERLRQALWASRRIHRRAVPASTSYQAFLKLLVRWTKPLRDELAQALRARMNEEFPRLFRIAGFVPIGGDGSEMGLPRTQSNEARFSARKTRRWRKPRRGQRSRSRKAQQQRARQKKADSPQLALTALLHLGLRLPWDWRVGPSDDSERDHVLEMIPDLPPDALIAADCGFVGYKFWRALLDSRRQFVIRVGGNVRLLKWLGVVRESAGIVYLWPDKAAKRGQPPLVLRLVVVQGLRHPWYLVTSVLDPRRLSDQQVAEIYRRRWGIELFFRHFKQTFHRSKLRSHKAEHVECEVQWSLLGLWTMLLSAQQHRSDLTESPARLSVARVLRAFRKAITNSIDAGSSLSELIAVAVIDSYSRRDKRSRGYPRKKYDPPAKPPRITDATQQQRKLAQQHAIEISPKGLTA